MKDKSLQKALTRGFTLIELMIVIVILGVLMGTILPRLTGAQARARDTARVADLNAIAQALLTYRDDNGVFPGTTDGTPECLNPASTTAGSASVAIKTYLKGGQIPTAPSNAQVTTLVGTTTVSCTGQYMYVPIRNRTIAHGGFILVSDIETYQKANYNNSTALTINASTELSAIASKVTNDSAPGSAAAMQTADANGLNTLYVLIGE